MTAHKMIVTYTQEEAQVFLVLVGDTEMQLEMRQHLCVAPIMWQ